MAPATLAQIANLLKLTPRYINLLAKEKGFPRATRGQYHVVDCVHWYIDYLKQQIDAAKRGGDARLTAELRKKQAEATLLEFKVAKERGSAITINDALQHIEPVLAGIRSKLLGIPKHAARELGSKEIEQYLDVYIRNVLDELSKIPDRFDGNRSVQESGHTEAALGPETPAQAQDQRMGRSISPAQSRGKRRKRPVGHS